MDAGKLSAITENPLYVPVHLGGNVADMDQIGGGEKA